MRSLRALFLTHVFHHIPDVERFLREAERVLVPGGVIAMIEVPHTPLARFFFRHFHPEPYDDRAATWAFDQSDAMLDSNQALSWIVFFRDRERFERLFPGLGVDPPGFLPWLGYLVSGGVTRRNLVPRLPGARVSRARPPAATARSVAGAALAPDGSQAPASLNAAHPRARRSCRAGHSW